jgi:hypothetical protein
MDNNVPASMSLLDKIKDDLAKNNLQDRTRQSRIWLMQNLKNLRVNQKKMLMDDKRYVRRIIPGKMYFYCYDPKLKEELPFWDKFPLTLVVRKYTDGFLGLNLHYLPIKNRIILLNKLYALANNTKFDESTKLKLSYQILEASSRFKEYAPCLKRYLTGHIKSRVLNIESSMWEVALFVPSEKFMKKKASTVQRESLKSIQSNR